MFTFLKRMFSSQQPPYASLVKEGGQIIDVRTPDEYRQGHIKGSVNIPLQELGQNLKKINKKKPVITCCASGMRSASAASFLKSKGYATVYNGGGWSSLQRALTQTTV